MTETSPGSHAGLNRRQFLEAAGAIAAGAVAPLVLPSRLFGADAPSNRVTMGFIGTGRQAMGMNIPEFMAVPGVQVVAVCDVDSWRLGEAKKLVEATYARQAPGGSYKGCDTYRDFRELLARKDIDAVMISTPDHWHAPMAVAALKAGKDVSLEKPITRYVSEGRRIVDLVEKHERVFRVDSEFRSLDRFHRAVELVRNGRIGKVHTIRSGSPVEEFPQESEAVTPVPPELDYQMWLGPAPDVPYIQKRVHAPHDLKSRPGWFRSRLFADGMLTNWGAHLNDIAQWGNDTERTGPVEVKATGKFHEGRVWNVLESFDAGTASPTASRCSTRWASRTCGSRATRAGSRSTTSRPTATPNWKPATPGSSARRSAPANCSSRCRASAWTSSTPARRAAGRWKTRRSASGRSRICHLAYVSIQRGGAKLRWDPGEGAVPRRRRSEQAVERTRASRPLEHSTDHETS